MKRESTGKQAPSAPRRDLPDFKSDPALAPYLPAVERREVRAAALRKRLASLSADGTLAGFASGHEWYGLHRTAGGSTVFRERAPNATAMWLVGDFSGWKRLPRYQARRDPATGDWEVADIPAGEIRHGMHYALHVEWPGGGGTRVPSFARRVVQDPDTKLFSAQVWDPPRPYRWRHPDWKVPDRDPLVYEAHVGMAQEKPAVGTWEEFRRETLPRVARAGYNTLQLMAVAEHPYYGSFGYQVSSFFAPSSRFGTPEELMALVDDAHDRGIAVVMDLVHSHSVRNEAEGLAEFDGTRGGLYFHDWRPLPGGRSEGRGRHPVWDSVLFDYGRDATLHYLLSNVRYWLDAFKFDGFRFDGVTSMLYLHHGIGVDFTGYPQYFGPDVDEDALAYLALANTLVHELRPDAVTIAEDVSGMPGLAAPVRDGGAGFDYRMAMGVTEAWGDLLRNVKDENWGMGWLLWRLSDKRADERVVSYFECHDQALVGGKTMFFEMAGADVYDAMHRGTLSPAVRRAVPLHEIARLATMAAAGGGYLCFMGNEFGHPEWIDFPREGNGWSFDKARRRWSLRDDPRLLFGPLAEFDRKAVAIFARRPRLLRTPLKRLVEDDLGKVLAFARGDVFFAFNFHPAETHGAYALAVPPGRYKVLLDSSAEAFGGPGGELRTGRVLRPEPVRRGREEVPTLFLRLPPRSAVVLERIR